MKGRVHAPVTAAQSVSEQYFTRKVNDDGISLRSILGTGTPSPMVELIVSTALVFERVTLNVPSKGERLSGKNWRKEKRKGFLKGKVNFPGVHIRRRSPQIKMWTRGWGAMGSR